MRRIFLHFVTLSLVLFLAACESSEERAEKHYENALALMAEGDNDRAIVELRNVFQLNGSHLEARHAIAKLILNHEGNKQGAYSQYLRLVEQYPDDLEARIALSRIAFQVGNWDELERHGSKAAELAPNDADVRVITMMRDYRAAFLNEDEDKLQTITQQALETVKARPKDLLLRELLIDNSIRGREFSEALAQLDIAIEQDPTLERYWSMRLQILIQLGDEEGTEAQLVDLVDRFPEDAERKAMLVRYYLARNRLDDTETFLRQLVEEAPADEPTPRVDLIRFLTELRGIDAAKLEIDRAIGTVENPTPFIILKAGLDFTTNNQELAISTLETLLESAEPSNETNGIRVTLARMFLTTGNEVGARSLVETVLADDPTNINALKMNANWLIEANDPNAAIAALRTALDQDSEDADALTLMASAYDRTGSTELARDFLSLAVEASNNAPEETIRYVRLLISEERYLPAEDLLLAAIRLEPQNVSLLNLAGQLYISMDDQGRAEQVVETLRRIDTPEASQAAIRIEAERLNQNSGIEGALSYLSDVANAADATLTSQVMLIRAQLASGNGEAAIELAEKLLADNPDDPSAQLVVAAAAGGGGDLARAEEIYRSILVKFPEEAGIWSQLSQIKMRQGEPEAARAIIEEGLALNPESPQLLWATASFLERDGDFESSIAIYERMYAEDTSSMIVANNLASLLAAHRSDPESLDRAWNIARRFRDSDIPAIQDTYGWIIHLRGDSGEAVDYLLSAAENLPSDTLTQFHLAEVLFALDRSEEALAQYRVVLELAGATDTRPQIAVARERLAALEEAAENQ